MTRAGIIAQLYADGVEPRPFSIFTAVPSEIEANVKWRERAQAWGDTHVGAHGHYTP